PTSVIGVGVGVDVVVVVGVGVGLGVEVTPEVAVGVGVPPPLQLFKKFWLKILKSNTLTIPSPLISALFEPVFKKLLAKIPKSKTLITPSVFKSAVQLLEPTPSIVKPKYGLLNVSSLEENS